MEKNYNEDEELLKIAPTLLKIEKKDVFVTPENYFEKLPGLMQDKMNAKVKAKNYWVPTYKLALAAASVCLLFFLGAKFFNTTKTNIPEITATEIAVDYDIHFLATSDEMDIAEQMDDESLEKTQNQIDINSGLSNKEIEDYLINNDIDLTTLTNEF